MKKTIAIAAFAAALSLQASDGGLTVTTDFSYATKYIFRGVQLGGDAVHPSIEVSVGDFYTGVWANIPVGGRSTFPNNEEFNLYLGRNIKLSDTIGLDAGYTYYYFPELPKGAERGRSEIYLGMNFDAGSILPGLYAFYDFDREAFTIQGSVGTSLPLETIGASLDLTAAVGHVDSQTRVSYTYWSLGASIPFRLSDRATITLGGTYASHNIDGLDDDNLGASLSLTLGF